MGTRSPFRHRSSPPRVAARVGATEGRSPQICISQAITHAQRREWKPAEDKLLAAIKAGPKSGRGVIRRFIDRDDYYPEFYLGVVYLNTGRVGAALVQFQLARKTTSTRAPAISVS